VGVRGWRFHNRLFLQVKAAVNGIATAVLPTFYSPNRPRCRVTRMSDNSRLSDIVELVVTISPLATEYPPDA
jgi:hypothetical protein